MMFNTKWMCPILNLSLIDHQEKKVRKRRVKVTFCHECKFTLHATIYCNNLARVQLFPRKLHIFPPRRLEMDINDIFASRREKSRPLNGRLYQESIVSLFEIHNYRHYTPLKRIDYR
jgi:hypothetical protein